MSERRRRPSVPRSADGALSRRNFLRHVAVGTAFLGSGAALSGCAVPAAEPPPAAAPAPPAPAVDGKMVRYSQAEAAYQDFPNNGQRCAGCRFFVEPNACQIVTGTISPDGWCRFYDPIA